MCCSCGRQHDLINRHTTSNRNELQSCDFETFHGPFFKINVMDIFPPHWPLAKMTLPLKFGVQRLDRLVVGYLMELIATQPDPDQCRKSISSFAKTLTVRVAMYLAKLIASLLRPVLHHPCMTLTGDDAISLLTSQFWVRPVYEELLHAASRFNLSPAAEFKRPTSNLVKIASHTKTKPQDKRNMHPLHSTMTDWLGADCPVDFLNVPLWCLKNCNKEKSNTGKIMSCGSMPLHTLPTARS